MNKTNAVLTKVGTYPGLFGEIRFAQPITVTANERIAVEYDFAKGERTVLIETPLLDEDMPEARRRQAALRSECAANWELAKGRTAGNITEIGVNQHAYEHQARHTLATMRKNRRPLARLLRLFKR